MLCHFRISIAGSPPQTVVFQLYPDKCPKTCDNFISLCQSSAIAKRPSSSSIRGKDHAPTPTYRGTEFHRIIPGFMIQGGDFTNFDGKGGCAAPTTNQGNHTFEDENFDISHDQEGILSMANKGKNTNGSQFFITLGKALHLDKKHVAFGKVVRGMEVIREASQVETEGDNGRPCMMQRVVIVDCGIGTGDEDKSVDSDSSSSSSSSASSSVNDSRKRKRSRSSKSKKKRKKRSGMYDDEYQHKKKKSRSSKHRSKSSKRKHYKEDDCKRKKKRSDKTSHRHRSHSGDECEGDERYSSKER